MIRNLQLDLTDWHYLIAIGEYGNSRKGWSCLSESVRGRFPGSRM